MVIAVSDSVKDAVLTSAYKRHKRNCPDLTDNQHFKHLAKTLIPPRIPGSPAFFRERFSELLAVVNKHGMPTFFLTLTTDEVSQELRWEEFKNLETFLGQFNCADLDWQKAPVECATIFHERVQAFMKHHVRASAG